MINQEGSRESKQASPRFASDVSRIFENGGMTTSMMRPLGRRATGLDVDFLAPVPPAATGLPTPKRRWVSLAFLLEEDVGTILDTGSSLLSLFRLLVPIAGFDVRTSDARGSHHLQGCGMAELCTGCSARSSRQKSSHV